MIAGTLGAVFLPWLAGVCLLAGWGAGSRTLNAATVWGYGYVLGMLLVGWIMRGFSLLGIGFSVAGISSVLVVVAAAALWGTRARAPWRLLGSRPGRWDWFIALVLAVIVVRMVLLGVGIAVQPLVGVDTWWFWASKARIWYEHGELVPFVGRYAWLGMEHGSQLVYSDPQAGYPATVPLIKTWTALWLGQWHEAWTNWPWLGLFAGMLVAVYGQVRVVASARYSMLAALLMASLPMIDTNVFAAGLADLFVAAGFLLALMGLFQYARSRDTRQLGLLAVGLLLCVTTKDVGVVWGLCIVPGVVFCLAPRRYWLPLVALGVIVAAALWMVWMTSGVELLGFGYEKLEPSFRQRAVLPVLAAFFTEEGWHLLWYLVVATAAVLVWRRSMSMPEGLLTLCLGLSLAVLAYIFLFTGFAASAIVPNAFSRHVLHLAPGALFLCVVVWSALLEPHPNTDAGYSQGNR